MGVTKNINRASIYNNINDEFLRALNKFPNWPTDPVHAVAIIQEEIGELTQAILENIYEPTKSNLDNIEIEAVQCGAVIVRFLLALPYYQYNFSIQVNQGMSDE